MRYLERKRLALLSAADQWFLPSGLDAAYLFAAYDFAGQGTEAHALMDLSGNGYHLSKSSSNAVWSQGTGFTLSFPNALGVDDGGYLNNAALNELHIACVIVKFSGVSQNNRVPLVTAGGSNGHAQLYAALTAWNTADGSLESFISPGYLMHGSEMAVYLKPRGTAMTGGVIGANVDSQSGPLYVNGSPQEVLTAGHISASISGTCLTFGGSHSDKSELNNAKWGTRTISSAAFFSVSLSDAYHAAIAAAMP